MFAPFHVDKAEQHPNLFIGADEHVLLPLPFLLLLLESFFLCRDLLRGKGRALGLAVAGRRQEDAGGEEEASRGTKTTRRR